MSDVRRQKRTRIGDAAWIQWLGRRASRRTAPVLVGLSTICGVCVGFNGWFAIPTIALLLGAGLISFAHDEWRRVDRASSEAEVISALEELSEQHAKFADVFAELARKAADMADKAKTDRESDFAILVKQAVTAIAFMLHGDIDGVRAVVYQVSADERRMDVVDWAANGHRMAPGPFIAGTDRGDAAFRTLKDGESVFVDDIALAAGRYPGSGNGFDTFITTPITSATGGFGLLTVDAPEKETLTVDDENDLRLIAGILAMIFAEKNRRSPGRTAGSPTL